MLIQFLWLFGTPIALFLGFKSWRKWREKRLLQKAASAPFPDNYKTMLSRFRPYTFLSDEEKKSFQTKVTYFLENKSFQGVDPLIVTEEMKFFVAAEACLMITNIPGEIYPGLQNIYLMEDVFIPKDNPVNPQTGLPTHSARLGEAWKGGPIVLSWKSISEGSSVIFHEFSHQLDQQDGSFDGTPKLGKNGNYDRWAEVMGEEFLRLRDLVGSHRHSDIDSYGATNEAEFFAVVTEYFFTNPKLLQGRHPKVYDIFKSYFKLNPIEWK